MRNQISQHLLLLISVFISRNTRPVDKGIRVQVVTRPIVVNTKSLDGLEEISSNLIKLFTWTRGGTD